MQSNSVFSIKHKRSLEFLHGTPESPQEHCHKSRGTLMSLQKQERAPSTPNQLEVRADFPCIGSKGITRSPSNTTSGFTSFRKLQSFPANTVPSLKEYQNQHSNSRKAPFTPNHFEMTADSLALTQEECHLSTSTSREGFSQL